MFGITFLTHGLIYGVVKILYAKFFRKVLFDAIDDPDKNWDEVAMAMVDALFKYKKK